MSAQSFCLNIGERYVAIADVDDKKKSLNTKSLAFNEIPFSVYSVTAQEYAAKASELIRKLVTDAKISKTDTNIIIPDSQSYTRIFDMPLLTDKELISAIRYQADQFIPIPSSQVSLDIHVIYKDKKNNRTNILLVAAPHTVIDYIVKIAEDAALMPVNIENETSAVLRLISKINELQDKKEGSAIYINFGNSSSSLYLYDLLNNIPLQVHNFAIGKQIFYKDISANFNLNKEQISDLIENVGFTDAQTQYNLHEVLQSPFNEFVTEIQRFVISSKEQSAADVRHIYLFGEGTKFAGIEQKISSVIGLPVELFDISNYMQKNNVTEYFKQDWPILVPAVGGSLL